jgi:streptomycin 3"-adenylyltransferase
LEITVARTADLKPWRYPARVELQLGEWMRADLDAGHLPGPHESADLCVLVSQLIDGARILFGPEPAALVARPPDADVRRAIVESVPLLLDDLETDTANVLLTLARMAFTLETGKFAPKDVAADWAITRWQTDDTAALERARDVYLGEHRDEWADLLVETRATAERLTNEIRHHAER